MSEATVPARLRAHMTPGAMLRTIRELQAMSQADLAQASGVSQPAISAVESGATPLGLERARKLAEALRVHPAVLLFSDWEPPVATPAKRRAVAAKSRQTSAG